MLRLRLRLASRSFQTGKQVFMVGIQLCVCHDYEVCVRSEKSKAGWMDGWLVVL
jgi:hypothetical protein